MELGLGSLDYDVGDRALVIGVLPGTNGTRCRPFEVLRSDAGRLVAAGADAIDAGDPVTWVPPESTPERIPPDPNARRELEKVARVAAALRADVGVPIVVRTSSLDVLRAAVDAGIELATDPTGCFAAEYLAAVAASGASVVITPALDVLGAASTAETVTIVEEALRTGAERALAAGIPRRRILVDAGADRAPTAAAAVAILGATARLVALGFPVQFTSPARSGSGSPAHQALFASAVDSDDEIPIPDHRPRSAAGALALAITTGASVVRVDDVREARRVADVVADIRRAEAS
jgi:dihydropteroate synthase